jgi:cellulase (glycosyl hydrolase family 5)
MRLRHLLLVVSIVLMLVPSSSSAATRMLVGFQDDPSFRWKDDRAAVLDIAAQQADAQIVRTTVYWSRTAPQKPANGANPADPAYNFSDLDELVQSAELRGMQVMLTIWGTPTWANGGKGQNFAPTNLADLTNFAKALAKRYSGTFNGLPYVRYFTFWNESNLQQFLSPQYDARGKPAAPFIYAKMFRAAYTGIKAGNPSALVGIGETSARGRDHFLGAEGTQETESPGRFAQLLSTVRPRLKFDAWSQHPYPTTLTELPTAKVRFPNVTMALLPTFEQSLDKWFGRKGIPIWITEYGYQTKPGQPKGVTYAQQAAYAKTAITMAKNDPRIGIFIWFIFRDDPTSTWVSGLLQRDGAKKALFPVFTALAHLVDGRNPIVNVTGQVRNPAVRLSLLELRARDGAGAVVGATARVYLKGVLVGVSQPQSTIGVDGFASFPLPLITASNREYTATLDVGDANGNRVTRSVTIISK